MLSRGGNRANDNSTGNTTTNRSTVPTVQNLGPSLSLRFVFSLYLSSHYIDLVPSLSHFFFVFPTSGSAKFHTNHRFFSFFYLSPRSCYFFSFFFRHNDFLSSLCFSESRVSQLSDDSSFIYHHFSHHHFGHSIHSYVDDDKPRES